MREPINLSDTTLEVLTKMAEGNPGAITVLMELLDRKEDPGALMVVLALDDMNCRGSQIWVGYKDHCEQDIEVFAQKIKDRDQGMVDAINNECYHPEMDHEGYQHQAVTSGASFDSVAGQLPDIRGMGL